MIDQQHIKRDTALGWVLVVLALATLALACTEVNEFEIGGAGAGEACLQISDCDPGFICEADLCVAVPPFDGGRGQPCADGCQQYGLVCGTQGVCTFSEGAVAGSACGLSIDCQVGLVCHGDDLICVDPNDVPDGAGAKDLGESCISFTDCRRPYLCAIADAAAAECVKIPFFPGPNCIRTEEEVGAFRVYYELPPEPVPADEPFEFYRLPFPNDIRVVDGAISLSGHPSPGEVMGIDVAGEYIHAIEEEVEGFALNGPVFFRLTDYPQHASICLDPGGRMPNIPEDPLCPGGGEASVYLINIDPNSPGYDVPLPIQVALFKDRSQYMCQFGIGMGPLDGQPLRPNTTYAAVLTTALRDVRGDAPIQDLDFQAILAGSGDLPEQVFRATAPLRAWISDRNVDADRLAAAAVFTTGDPARVGQDLYDAVQALPSPTFNQDAFTCGVDEPPLVPPCHGRLLSGQSLAGRTCGNSADAYEIHGTYDAPIFQAGTRPYLTSAMGGALNLDVGGLPERVRDESMCYALAIPRNLSMPPAGWPVIMYSHGTGGNYRSFMNKTIMEDFLGLGFAVIGIDNVMHGPRQDPSANPNAWLADLWNVDQPGNLFFNVINPRAARDNTLQGAVDLFSLTRLLVNDAPQVAGIQTQFDPNQIYFIGHSQGTTIVSPFLVHETQLQAAILSGAGAELVLSILNKTEPVNIAEVTGTLFGDRSLSRIHPMMGLLAIFFGPADSVVYADRFVVNPPRRPLPLIMFSGIGDSFTPDATQEALIRSMGIPLIRDAVMHFPGVEEVWPPVSDVDIFGIAAGVPAGAVQIQPLSGTGSDDGHFVLFNYQYARDFLVHFLDTSLNLGAPEIGR